MNTSNTRTNIVLDDSLVERAMQKANVYTKREAVEAALKAFVRLPDWDFALSLRGSNLVHNDYDPIDEPSITIMKARKPVEPSQNIRIARPVTRASAKRKPALA